MGNIPDYKSKDMNFEIRAKDLVSKMTLEEKVTQMLHSAPAIPRLGIKAYNWWNEALHGVARAGTATVFPQAIGMAATTYRYMKQEALYPFGYWLSYSKFEY